jgi:hypothetical protein
MSMKRVIIESPYAGDVERNVAYARAAVRDSVLRGESPIASHLLFTQEGVLNDLIQEERALGIKAGLAWRAVCDYAVFYLDHGESSGMQLARCAYAEDYIPVVDRKLF